MTSEPADPGTPGHRGVERATAMLRLLAQHPAGLSLSDLARESDLPLTTAYRIVSALRDAELIRETVDGRQALGVGTVALAGAFLGGLDLRAKARGALERLSDETGETCFLGVLASPHVVYLDIIDGRHRIRTVARVGGSQPALASAIGRSILTYSPVELRRGVVNDSLRMFGEDVDATEFARQLPEIEKLGYATDLEDTGICCVGAPIFSHTGEAVAGISVSTPAARFTAERVQEAGLLIRAEADRVSHEMGWAPGSTAIWRTER